LGEGRVRDAFYERIKVGETLVGVFEDGGVYVSLFKRKIFYA
jgi:hypothetical protein